MITPPPYLADLRKAIESPTEGFVSIVDDLLALCRKHTLRLTWRDNICHVKTVGTELEVSIDVSLRKSGFRTILARIAKLCDDQAPGTFSPYGGTGKLSDVELTWMNTTSEQWLEVAPVRNPQTQASFPKNEASINSPAAVAIEEKD